MKMDVAEKKRLWRNIFIANLSLLLLLLIWIFLPLFYQSPVQSTTKEEIPGYQITIPNLAEVGDSLTGSIIYTINAKEGDTATYFDFSRGGVVAIQDRASLDWDLGFSRVKIISNSGITNPKGKGGILNLGKKDFYSLKDVPEEGYITDTVSGDIIGSRNEAIDRWFNYKWLTHKLTSRGEVYAIRTADGRYAKMRILNYYCKGDVSGCITIEYVYQGNGTNRVGM